MANIFYPVKGKQTAKVGSFRYEFTSKKSWNDANFIQSLYLSTEKPIFAQYSMECISNTFRQGRRNKVIVVMDFDSTGNGNASEITEIIDKNIKTPGRFIYYDVDKRMTGFTSFEGLIDKLLICLVLCLFSVGGSYSSLWLKLLWSSAFWFVCAQSSNVCLSDESIVISVC